MSPYERKLARGERMSETQHEQNINEGNQEAKDTHQFQVLEGEDTIAREAQLQAQRDKDARQAEDQLRRERDLEARAAIDVALKEMIANVTQRLIDDTKAATEDTIKEIRARAAIDSANINNELQQQVTAQQDAMIASANEVVRRADVRLAEIFGEARTKIDDRLIDLTNSFFDQFKTATHGRIDEIAALIRQQEQHASTQRDRAAREADVKAHEERDRDLRSQGQQLMNNIAVDVKRDFEIKSRSPIVATVEATVEVAKSMREANLSIIKDLSDRIIDKQGYIVGAKSVLDAAKTQHEMFLDTAQTMFRIYSNIFTFGARAAESIGK